MLHRLDLPRRGVWLTQSVQSALASANATLRWTPPAAATARACPPKPGPPAACDAAEIGSYQLSYADPPPSRFSKPPSSLDARGSSSRRRASVAPKLEFP